jgi:uncharacterized protein
MDLLGGGYGKVARPEVGLDTSILIVVAATFVFAAFIKGVIGSGLPSISLGILVTVMPPAQAAALIVLPSLVTNILQSIGPGLVPLTRRIWLMLAGLCVGAWLGAGLLTGDTGGRARTALGIALMIYAAMGLVKIKMSLPKRAEWWLAPLVGVATGVVTAATGVFVIPSGFYLQALDLNKDELVQVLGITYTVATVALAATLTHGMEFSASLMWVSALALVATLAGLVLGQMVRARIREETFRLCFFVGLLLLGVELALHDLLW